MIKEQIERCEITSISIDKLDSSFVDMLFSCLEGIDISVINRYYKPSISNNLATFLLKQIIFAVRFIFSWSLFLGFKTKKNKSKYESIYHSIYPLLWSNCKEIKYGLSFRKQAFLLSLLSDGMHQGLSLKNFIQAFKAIKKSESTKNLILDSYLKLRDLKSLVYWSYNLRKKFKLIYIKFPPFKSIDIRKSIFDQLLISSIRIPRLITISKAYSRVVLNHNFTNFHYHLFEYSYGRMLTAIFRENSPKTNLIGYQHGPISNLKLCSWLDRREGELGQLNPNHVPIPNKILVEDKYSAKKYDKSGYKNIEVMQQIPRIEYLRSINRSVRKGTILIACGLHDTYQIFHAIKNRFGENMSSTYLFKFHPRSKNNSEISNYIKSFGNVKCVNGPIEHYLSFVEKVICTYSSVGEEAKLLGISIEIILLNDKINESNLLDK